MSDEWANAVDSKVRRKLAGGFRDHVAWLACSLVMNTVATRRYRDRIDAYLRYGFIVALREDAERHEPGAR